MIDRKKFLEVVAYANQNRVTLVQFEVEKRRVMLSTFEKPKGIRGRICPKSTKTSDFFDIVKHEIDRLRQIQPLRVEEPEVELVVKTNQLSIEF